MSEKEISFSQVILAKLEQHENEFRDFVAIDKEYKGRASVAITQISQMYTTITDIGLNTKALPEISATLKEFRQDSTEIKNKLIDPAVGINRMDLKAVYLLIGVLGAVIILLSLIIIVSMVVQTDSSVSAKTGIGSFNIDNGNKNQEIPKIQK